MNNQTEKHHEPVLVNEFLSFYKDTNISNFLDITIGAGGHALKILSAHPEIERLVGSDRDQSALKISKDVLRDFQSKVNLIYGSFKDVISDLNNQKFDGIIADLGVSSMQLDSCERGFSFSKDGDLDMRMDTTSGITAREIVNEFSEKDLGRIFYEYGEESFWRQAASAVIRYRYKKPIETTFDLKEALSRVFPLFVVRRRIHPVTKIFQALRIYVNNELEQLEWMLSNVFNLIASKGIICVISFHSLEDRIVKNAFKDAEKNGVGKILTKKPIAALDEEVKKNARSRSAKIRAFEVC